MQDGVRTMYGVVAWSLQVVVVLRSIATLTPALPATVAAAAVAAAAVAAAAVAVPVGRLLRSQPAKAGQRSLALQQQGHQQAGPQSSSSNSSSGLGLRRSVTGQMSSQLVLQTSTSIQRS